MMIFQTSRLVGDVKIPKEGMVTSIRSIPTATLEEEADPSTSPSQPISKPGVPGSPPVKIGHDLTLEGMLRWGFHV